VREVRGWGEGAGWGEGVRQVVRRQPIHTKTPTLPSLPTHVQARKPSREKGRRTRRCCMSWSCPQWYTSTPCRSRISGSAVFRMWLPFLALFPPVVMPGWVGEEASVGVTLCDCTLCVCALQTDSLTHTRNMNHSNLHTHSLGGQQARTGEDGVVANHVHDVRCPFRQHHLQPRLLHLVKPTPPPPTCQESVCGAVHPTIPVPALHTHTHTHTHALVGAGTHLVVSMKTMRRTTPGDTVNSST